jgi:hypothetical protein
MIIFTSKRCNGCVGYLNNTFNNIKKISYNKNDVGVFTAFNMWMYNKIIDHFNALDFSTGIKEGTLRYAETGSRVAKDILRRTLEESNKNNKQEELNDNRNNNTNIISNISNYVKNDILENADDISNNITNNLFDDKLDTKPEVKNATESSWKDYILQESINNVKEEPEGDFILYEEKFDNK